MVGLRRQRGGCSKVTRTAQSPLASGTEVSTPVHQGFQRSALGPACSMIGGTTWSEYSLERISKSIWMAGCKTNQPCQLCRLATRAKWRLVAHGADLTEPLATFVASLTK